MSALSEIMRFGQQMELSNLREYRERTEKHLHNLHRNMDRMSDDLMKFHNLKVILKEELDEETLARIYAKLNEHS